MKLYNVFYIDTTYGDLPHYEGTTDNFEKWLEKHNDERWGSFENADCGEDEQHKNRDCTCIEREDDFDVQETHLVIFDKEESE